MMDPLAQTTTARLLAGLGSASQGFLRKGM
jgi:hypothetical protein